jgi:hypothetical protein
MRRALSLVALVFALLGCSSGKKFVRLEVPSNQAVVYFYRESSMLGAAVSYRVRDLTPIVASGELKIVPSPRDGVEIAQDMKVVFEKTKPLALIKNGNYSYQRVGPGQHIYLVENDKYSWSTGRGFGQTPAIVRVIAEAGGEYYVHTWISGGARPHLGLVTEEVGAKKIRKCGLARNEQDED